MGRHITFFMLCLAVVKLFAVIWLIAGCDTERSLLTPDQEDFQAPAKGNPKINDNDDDDDDDKEPKGEAVGNPHVDDNPNANPNAGDNGNGKAKGKDKPKGNPHLSGGRARDRGKGAVKLPLRKEGESEGEVIGWVVINTTADATDEVEADEEDLTALDVSTNGFLIVTVHLRIRGEDVEEGLEFDVEVLVSGADDPFDFLEPLTVNAKGIGNAKAIFNLDVLGELDEETSEIYVKVVVEDEYDTGLDFVAVQLKK